MPNFLGDEIQKSKSVRFCVLSPSRGLPNFRPISEEIKNLVSIFEIAVAPHRNAMRARYKGRSEKTTNGVGIVTSLHSAYTESRVRRGGGWSQDEDRF